mgnify:CR=1 FL=1
MTSTLTRLALVLSLALGPLAAAVTAAAAGQAAPASPCLLYTSDAADE